jgi:hypothetical protein
MATVARLHETLPCRHGHRLALVQQSRVLGHLHRRRRALPVAQPTTQPSQPQSRQQVPRRPRSPFRLLSAAIHYHVHRSRSSRSPTLQLPSQRIAPYQLPSPLVTVVRLLRLSLSWGHLLVYLQPTVLLSGYLTSLRRLHHQEAQILREELHHHLRPQLAVPLNPYQCGQPGPQSRSVLCLHLPARTTVNNQLASYGSSL